MLKTLLLLTTALAVVYASGVVVPTRYNYGQDVRTHDSYVDENRDGQGYSDYGYGHEYSGLDDGHGYSDGDDGHGYRGVSDGHGYSGVLGHRAMGPRYRGHGHDYNIHGAVYRSPYHGYGPYLLYRVLA